MAADTNRGWHEVPHRIRCGRALGDPWESLFGPLRSASIVVGQLGQSLDGRIAREPGRMSVINGPEGIVHLHRLRVRWSMPWWSAPSRCGSTIRSSRCAMSEGPNLVRVVIDPRGTLPARSRAFAADGVHRIVITRQQSRSINGGIETIALPDIDGLIDPAAILDALQDRGLHRILVEGGGQTVSTFLSAGCLDRLHVMVAPMILGSGVAGLDLSPAALQAPRRAHTLGSDVLYDCDLRSGATADR